jgi:hypothetical protein
MPLDSQVGSLVKVAAKITVITGTSDFRFVEVSVNTFEGVLNPTSIALM